MTQSTPRTPDAGHDAPRDYHYGHLPVEDPTRTDLGRWFASLRILVSRPFARAVRMDAPVAHAGVVSLMWAVRWPTWMICSLPVFVAFLASAAPGGAADVGDPAAPAGLVSLAAGHMAAPSALELVLPAFFAQSLRVWLLLMVPLGVPLVYFAAGLAAHVVLILTGGAPRSMGTTMRAVGLAFIPPSLVLGIMDVGASFGLLGPEVWLACFVAVGAWLGVRIFFGVRRLQGLRRRRTLAVVPVSLLVLTSGVMLRATLVLPNLPGAPPPPELRYGAGIPGR